MTNNKSDLKSENKALRAKLAKAEARAERWKARAKQAEAGQAPTESAGGVPVERIGQAVTETLRVLTTTLDDVVTSARSTFEELAGSGRPRPSDAASDATATDTTAPPAPRPPWPPLIDDGTPKAPDATTDDSEADPA
jgi:hypothetical protein